MSLTFGRDDRQVEITKNISCSLSHFPIDILQLFLLSIVYIDFRVLKDKSGYAQRYLTFLYIFSLILKFLRWLPYIFVKLE